MSKVVYVCLREPGGSTAMVAKLHAAAKSLLPDNFTPASPRVLALDGIVIGVLNPSDLVRVEGCSVCVGYLADDAEWQRPQAALPDGAYALFRADRDRVDIVADELGSRTVWYFKNDALFIASTSQRAIVSLIGSFEFNERVVPWVIASGTLGPGLAWDRRIQHLRAGTRITLDRGSWTLSSQDHSSSFAPVQAAEAEHEQRIRETLGSVMSAARFDHSAWSLPLSGGIDCRTILCLLRNPRGLRSVTWGLASSQREPGNDAHVARKLARHFGLNHHFYETDLSGEPVERLFRRYLVCGEGRIDHISAYMDGFQIWKLLYEGGTRGIIRGDQVFGRKTVAEAADVHDSAGMHMWSDLTGVPALGQLGLPAQELPEDLRQQPDETLAGWRDRMQQCFRVPFVLAGLSDLKLPYVEIVSPLLSGTLVAAVRRLPDDLRTNKSLFRKIAHSLSPPIEFAKYAATEPATGILKAPAIVEFLKADLTDSRTTALVPRKLIDVVLQEMKTVPAHARRSRWRGLKRLAAWYFPALAARHKATGKPSPVRRLDANQVAFRIHMVSGMCELLREDARESTRMQG
jgi:hypothetical protein